MSTFTEDWVGSNGDPWPSWELDEGNSSPSSEHEATIQSNTGEQKANELSWRYDLAPVDPVTDFDLVVTIDPRDISTEGSYPAILARWDRSTESGYYIELTAIEGGGAWINILAAPSYGIVWSGATTLDLSSFTRYRWRVSLSGTSIRTKLWPEGGSEPSSWYFEATDSTYSNTGDVGLGFYSDDGTREVRWDDLTSDIDDPDPGPDPDPDPGPTSEWSIVDSVPNMPSGSWDVAFSPDSGLLAIAHGDPYLTVLNTSDWSQVSGIPSVVSSAGRGVSFSPDGQYLAFAYWESGSSPLTHLTVFRTSNWSVVEGTPSLPDDGYGVSFSPDSNFLVAMHAGSPYMTIIDTSDWSVVSGTPTIDGIGYSADFSPDGSYLAVSHFMSPGVTVLNASDWSVVSGLPALEGVGHAVAFYSEYLAIGRSDSPFLTVLSVPTWSVVAGVPTPPNQVFGVAFSSDGYFAAAHFPPPGFGSPALTVTKTPGWTEIGMPDLPPEFVDGYGVAFSNNNRYLAIAYSGSPDNLTVFERLSFLGLALRGRAISWSDLQ